MDYIQIIKCFGLTLIMSFIFGLDRQLTNKPIGFGTFIFVSIGSCGLALVAKTFDANNPMPLLGAIVTGIGFLGAGALIKTTDKIYGFTSAASIWIFSIIGMLNGIGYHFIALIIYAIIWIIVLIDKYMEIKSIGSYQKKIYIASNKNLTKDRIKKILGVKKYKTLSLSYNKAEKDYAIHIIATGTKKKIDEIPKILLEMKDVTAFKIE